MNVFDDVRQKIALVKRTDYHRSTLCCVTFVHDRVHVHRVRNYEKIGYFPVKRGRIDFVRFGRVVSVDRNRRNTNYLFEISLLVGSETNFCLMFVVAHVKSWHVNDTRGSPEDRVFSINRIKNIVILFSFNRVHIIYVAREVFKKSNLTC